MSSAVFKLWGDMYGGMTAFLISEIKDPKAKNAVLKVLFAGINTQNELLKV